MKRCLTLFGVLLTLCAYSHLTVSSAKADAHRVFRFNTKPQCVVACGIENGCQVCVGGTTGRICFTSDCNNCTTSGTCGRPGLGEIRTFIVESPNRDEIKRSPESIPQQDPEPEAQESFRLDRDTIKEIAIVHPRFAATLANINVYGFSPELKVYRVHWTPVELSPDDIDAFLDKSANPEFFERYNRRGQELNRLIQKGLMEVIVYDLTVESSVNTRTIKLSVRNDPAKITVDPQYSLLEITLQYEDKAINNEGIKGVLKTKTWRID